MIEELATKVYKSNKRGIDVHFLNQQKREGITLKVSEVSFGQVASVHAEAKSKMRQTKSETRKLFKATTLYYGQPVGTRLEDLFDQYVQGGRTVGSEKRKRDILVVSDGAPCEPALSLSIPHRSHAFSGGPRECPGRYIQEARWTGTSQAIGERPLLSTIPGYRTNES